MYVFLINLSGLYAKYSALLRRVLQLYISNIVRRLKKIQHHIDILDEIADLLEHKAGKVLFYAHRFNCYPFFHENSFGLFYIKKLLVCKRLHYISRKGDTTIYEYMINSVEGYGNTNSKESKLV